MKREPSIRLFLDATLDEGVAIACARPQINYLRNVMRLGDGDEVLVFNGVSGEWRARLEVRGKHDLVLIPTEQTRQQINGPDIHYLFAPLKRARLDYMVQKATELGVAALSPVITRNTEVSRVNTSRMKANVVEAAEQCGVLRVPDVAEPVTLTKVLDGWDEKRRIVYADEDAPVVAPVQVLEGIVDKKLAVLVGPEGGFDESERERLRGLPFVTPVSLGPRVMRADTAAVALLALVNAVLGDWR